MDILTILFITIIPVFAQEPSFDDQLVSSTEYTKIVTRLYDLETTTNELETEIKKIDEKSSNLESRLSNLESRLDKLTADQQDSKSILTDISNEVKDRRFDWVSSIGAILALIIAGLIFYVQHKQNTKLETIATSTHNVVQEQDQIQKEIQEDVAYHLNSNLGTVIRELQHCLALYEKWKKETNDTKKTNFKNSIANAYDRCFTFLKLDIPLLELMRIFGRATARQYHGLLTKMGLHSSLYQLEDDDELPAFISRIAECLKECEDLKKVIEPLASKVVKSRN